nr:SDR family NAD(P)-dependent oxidoreductase [Sphingomonas sp. CDS-1]
MEKSKRLEGKVAIVTGGGRGLGRAEALALAEAGARLIVNDLGASPTGEGDHENVAQSVVEEIKAMRGEAVANGDDIATMAGGRNLVEAAMDSFGRVDILVNNAGIARPSPIYEMSEADWDAVIAVHLKGHFTTIRHAAPLMIKQRSGVIINTASQSGLGHWGMSNYSAAKEGVVGFTRSVARDVGQFGVRCNAVRPLGMTRLGTPAVMETVRYSQEELGIPANGNVWVGATTNIPLPEQVGVCVAWLCTDAAANVNGRTFFAGGGSIGLYPEPDLERSCHQPGGWTLDTLDEGARAYLVGDLTNMFQGRGVSR